MFAPALLVSVLLEHVVWLIVHVDLVLTIPFHCVDGFYVLILLLFPFLRESFSSQQMSHSFLHTYIDFHCLIHKYSLLRDLKNTDHVSPITVHLDNYLTIVPTIESCHYLNGLLA